MTPNQIRIIIDFCIAHKLRLNGNKPTNPLTIPKNTDTSFTIQNMSDNYVMIETSGKRFHASGALWAANMTLTQALRLARSKL